MKKVRVGNKNLTLWTLEELRERDDLLEMNYPIPVPAPMKNSDISVIFNRHINRKEQEKKYYLEHPDKHPGVWLKQQGYDVPEEIVCHNVEDIERSFWDILKRNLDHQGCYIIQTYPGTHNSVSYGQYANICNSFVDQYDLIMGFEKQTHLHLCVFLRDNHTEKIANPKSLKRNKMFQALIEILKKNGFIFHSRVNSPRQNELVGWRKIKLNGQTIVFNNDSLFSEFFLEEDRYIYAWTLTDIFNQMYRQIKYFIENNYSISQRVAHSISLEKH